MPPVFHNMLLSQVLEFRQMGWSDRASVCLGVEKTGGVITAAGLIMSISFAGITSFLCHGVGYKRCQK
jgi:uncharacterized membrane protein YdfJ with MMPL/SSD domain